MSRFNSNEWVATSFEEFSPKFDNYLNQIVQFSQEDKLFLASKLLNYLTTSLRRFESEPNHQMEARRMTERMNNRLGVQFEHKLEKESQEMRTVLNVMKNQQGWSLVKDSNGIKTYYQNESSNPIHSIKMIGRINAPLMNILAVIYEIDLYNNWWPLSKDVKEIQKNSRYQKIVRMVLELPWPVWNRDVLFYAYGVDNLEDDQLLIMFRSCTPEEERGANIQPIPKTVRTEWHEGGMLITPISPNETEVCILANVDPKLEFAPIKLINTFTKHLSPLMFERLRTQSLDIRGSEYERRIQANPNVYKEIQDRLALYFQAKQGHRIPTQQTMPSSVIQHQIPSAQVAPIQGVQTQPITSQIPYQYYTHQTPQTVQQQIPQLYAQQAQQANQFPQQYAQQIPHLYGQQQAQQIPQQYAQYLQPQTVREVPVSTQTSGLDYSQYFQHTGSSGVTQLTNVGENAQKPQQYTQYPGGTQIPSSAYSQYFSK